VELKRCIPGSFDINTMATYHQFRIRAVGSTRPAVVDGPARAAGADLTSDAVFEQDDRAVRLYCSLEYEPVKRRPVVLQPRRRTSVTRCF